MCNSFPFSAVRCVSTLRDFLCLPFALTKLLRLHTVDETTIAYVSRRLEAAHRLLRRKGYSVAASFSNDWATDKLERTGAGPADGQAAGQAACIQRGF